MRIELRRALAWSLCTACVLSCATDGEAETDSGTEAEVPREPADPPVFIQPASGVLMLNSNRVNDVELRVTSIDGVSTRFVLDDTSYGDLSATPWVGDLEAELLRLRIRGGLVSAHHAFFLETPSVDEPARSAEIQVNVLVDTVPKVTASLGNTAPIRGHAVMAQGIDEESVLLVYDDAGSQGPTVSAFRTSANGWDSANPLVVPVPRLATPATQSLPLAGAVATGGTEDRSDDRLRLAWRASAESIDYVDRPWAAGAGVVRTALSLQQLDTESFEHASVGRPWIVGDTILIETNLLTDTESPRPGDRRVTTVHLTGRPADPGPAHLTAALGVVDIDRIGQALDFATAETGGPRPIAARVHGAQAAVFEVDPTSGILRLRGAATSLDGWQDARNPVTAALGAFGSRTMLGVSGGQVMVQAFDDSAGFDPADASTGFVGGGTNNDAGPPATTMLAGHPVVLVPMGSEHPVQAVTVAGARISSDVLDLLRCEEIALPATKTALTGMSVQFACRGDDEIRFGTLAIVP